MSYTGAIDHSPDGCCTMDTFFACRSPLPLSHANAAWITRFRSAGSGAAQYSASARHTWPYPTLYLSAGYSPRTCAPSSTARRCTSSGAPPASGTRSKRSTSSPGRSATSRTSCTLLSGIRSLAA